jgi:hypothetical protein
MPSNSNAGRYSCGGSVPSDSKSAQGCGPVQSGIQTGGVRTTSMAMHTGSAKGPGTGSSGPPRPQHGTVEYGNKQTNSSPHAAHSEGGGPTRQAAATGNVKQLTPDR